MKTKLIRPHSKGCCVAEYNPELETNDEIEENKCLPMMNPNLKTCAVKRIWLRLKRGVLARQQFVDSHTSKAIAFQIREMRTRSGWSQAELAERCGTSHSAISRLESPGYGRPSISTLKKIAAAFDVGLVVRFASFGEIADWASSLTPASVLVPTFQEEDERKQQEAKASGNFIRPHSKGCCVAEYNPELEPWYFTDKLVLRDAIGRKGWWPELASLALPRRRLRREASLEAADDE